MYAKIENNIIVSYSSEKITDGFYLDQETQPWQKVLNKIDTWTKTKDGETIYTLEVENTADLNLYLYDRDLNTVKRNFESKIKEFLKDYSASEILTFETKRTEAEKFIETWKSFYIEALATAKSLTPTEIAEAILVKAKVFAEAYIALEAWKSKEKEALKLKYNII